MCVGGCMCVFSGVRLRKREEQTNCTVFEDLKGDFVELFPVPFVYLAQGCYSRPTILFSLGPGLAYSGVESGEQTQRREAGASTPQHLV